MTTKILRLSHCMAIALLLSCLQFPALADTATISEAALRLDALLNEEQRQLWRHALKDNRRATWSNLPTLMAPPAGIMLGALDDDQRQAAVQLIAASLSSQGYAKTLAIMWLDDLLKDTEAAELAALPPSERNPIRVAMAGNRDSGNYAIALFGDPADDRWGWKITGHHLAINITVVDGAVGFLPSFLGSNPRVVPAGPYAGWMALPNDGRLGLAVMASLTEAQKKSALLAPEVPDDVFAGPGRRESLAKYEGLPATRLEPDQLAGLQRLVIEYLNNARDTAAGVQLDAIASAGWGNVWFSWRGGLDPDDVFYYRVHGPRILIEYNRQNPNHDHAVVRDPQNDYGEDWLGHHYQEHHPSMEEVMADLQKRLPSR